MGTEQRFTGTPDTVAPGQTFTIKFTNKDLAGTTTNITVTLEDGSSQELPVTLNGSGKGSVEFTAPGTPQALTLSHSTSADFGVVVNTPPGPAGSKKKTKKAPAKKPPARSAAKGKTKR